MTTGPAGDHPREDGEAAAAIGRRRCVTITNALGLHMRAASKFVHLASGFRATILVAHGDHLANGKSILDLATLAADCGSRLEIVTSGPDAEAALTALVALVEAGFEEDDRT
jgi:phosphocarrier protein